MKLTTVTTTLKNNTLKMLAGAALAGAVLTAEAPAAQAQQVFFGVHVGGPVVYGPHYYAPAPPVVVYGRPGFYAPRYDWRYRDDYRFHHDWDRRDFDHRGWDRR
jgi:hypothetical protein